MTGDVGRLWTRAGLASAPVTGYSCARTPDARGLTPGTREAASHVTLAKLGPPGTRELAPGRREARELLVGDVGAAASEDVLLDLAGRRLGELLHEVEPLGGLEVGQVGAG